MNAFCKTTAMAAFILAARPSHSEAQYNPSKYEVGLSVGTFIYQGDLSASRFGNYQLLKPSLMVHGSRHLDQYFSLRANLAIGWLAADEALQPSPGYKQHRNFSFSTPVVELSGMLVWRPAGQNTGNRLSYHFMAGIGASALNVTRDFTRIDLAYFDVKDPAIAGMPADLAHRTPRVIPVLPVGAGLSYELTPSWSVNAEFIYRFTATDYLDGFKYTVNPSKRDSYYGLTAGVAYRFGGNRYRCPTVMR